MKLLTPILLFASFLLLALTPGATAAAPSECIDEGENYCVYTEGKSVCVRYHLGDLEGPYTTCTSSSVPLSASALCVTDDGYGACADSGCVTVYLGPNVRTQTVCPV